MLNFKSLKKPLKLLILRFTQDAKSIFLANMSHEIRTPLSAILGYSQILQRKSDLQSDVRNAVSTIKNSGEHLLALINDILDLSKIEVGRMELQNADFDLTALIDTLSTMFRMRCEQKGLAWRVEWQEGREGKEGMEGDTSLPSFLPFPPFRILVHGDEGKLRQVLLNLLSNAVKFTDSGEVILRISTSHSHTHPLTHSLFLFEVIDTGVGIPPQDREIIFEPFQQGQEGAAKGGTGLGLTIAKRQIELMGGKLDFESPFSLLPSPSPSPQPSPVKGEGRGEGSECGVGTRFFFTLPFEPAKEMSSLPAEAKRTVVHLAEGYQVKALVADDVPETRDVLSKFLSDISLRINSQAKSSSRLQSTGNYS
jgi:signal transduction histidine kinase